MQLIHAALRVSDSSTIPAFSLVSQTKSITSRLLLPRTRAANSHALSSCLFNSFTQVFGMETAVKL